MHPCFSDFTESMLTERYDDVEVEQAMEEEDIEQGMCIDKVPTRLPGLSVLKHSEQV